MHPRGYAAWICILIFRALFDEILEFIVIAYYAIIGGSANNMPTYFFI